MSQTSELAFESCLETILHDRAGLVSGAGEGWDVERALFADRVCSSRAGGHPDHLPLDRDATVVKLGDEVALQFYRLERISSGAIEVGEGDTQYVKSPTQVGTGRAQEERVHLSQIIEVLNERFGTQFTEEDRLFFQQIKERACRSEQVIQTALANPLDRFELGVPRLIEDLMLERMAENDKIVTRYISDREFQGSAFPLLAREIFQAIRAVAGSVPAPGGRS